MYGFYIVPDKLQAILLGDTSGSILQSFLIHYANLVGWCVIFLSYDSQAEIHTASYIKNGLDITSS